MDKATFEKKLTTEIESNRKPKKLLLCDVREQLRPLGMQIALVGGEYRVKHVGQRWAQAYFTNDLTDALGTGKKISEELASVRQQIKEVEKKSKDASSRRRRSEGFGMNLGALVVELSEGDLDDKTAAQSLWDCTDAAHVAAARRVIAILSTFADDAPAGESDIERARR